MAYGDDVARATVAVAVFSRRRNDPRLISNVDDDARTEDDVDAREQSALHTRGHSSRTHPRPSSAAIHESTLPAISPDLSHAVLGRRLGALLGVHSVGPWI